MYEYPEEDLKIYSWLVCEEMELRGYKIKNPVSLDREYFRAPFKKHHNDEYMTICYWNLREKYIRGQIDFDDITWNKLKNFIEGEKKYGK